MINFAKLAETLIPHIHSDTDIAVEQARRIINSFQASYENKNNNQPECIKIGKEWGGFWSHEEVLRNRKSQSKKE